MERSRRRDVIEIDAIDPSPLPPPDGTPISGVPYAVAVEPAPVRRVEVETVRRVSLPAVLAGLMAIAMVVWGGVIVARAGLEDGLREPTASLLGLTGNALSGAIVAGLGVLLLLSALASDRAAIMFSSIIIGIAALIVAIEPSVADGALGFERDVPVLLAIGSAVVLFVTIVVPTMTSRTRTVDRT
jgi:hypothetical protein